MSVSSMIDRWAKTVGIQTPLYSSDAIGGVVETYSSELTTALVQIQSGSDAVVGGRENTARTGTFYFTPGKTITTKSRITYASTTWEVVSVRVPHERGATDPLSYIIVEARQALT